MARQVVSRTQRRMEKKQAMVLLVLVLAVSLVSFTLGVMVGRSGSPPAVAKATAKVPARVPVPRETSPAVAEGEPQKTSETLTYYDSLLKGEPSPLGSGINLPPKQPAAKTEKPAEKVEAPAKQEPAREKKKAPAPPAMVADGSYAVQVASFKGIEDARKLEKRLAAKNYAAFIEEADLKEKGIWHRVFAGPYANAEEAGDVVARLKSEENLSGLVRKR